MRHPSVVQIAFLNNSTEEHRENSKLCNLSTGGICVAAFIVACSITTSGTYAYAAKVHYV